MEQQPNDFTQQKADALNAVKEKLVKLGYASKILFDSKKGSMRILWTDRGLSFQKEFRRMFPDPDAEVSVLELMCLLALMLRDDPK